MNKFIALRLISVISLAAALVACSGEAAKEVVSNTKDAASTVAANAKEGVTEKVSEVATAANTVAAAKDKAMAVVAGDAAVLASGTFTGRNDHITTGDVSIVKTATGYQLVLAGDFSLDGAPDPIVALGNNGTYSPENKLAALKNITGAQTYEIPASINPADFSEAYIWCEQFNVSLGIAALASSNGAATASNATVVSTGTFSGRNDHITTGNVSVVKTATGYQLILAGDFSLDGAPDPIVALGNNGTYSPENKLAALKNITGAQTYEIPASMNPADFSEAYIWCEQFNVSLGTAALTSSNSAATTSNAAVVSAGTFTGRNDHITTGDVSVVKAASGYQLVLAGDFSLDGAPDPIVALGNNGTYSPENKLAALKNISGAQTYAIPASMNPADFSEAYIWCEQFNVSLGIAPLR